MFGALPRKVMVETLKRPEHRTIRACHDLFCEGLGVEPSNRLNLFPPRPVERMLCVEGGNPA